MKTLFIFILFNCLISSTLSSKVFKAEGSDLFMGIGAESISKSGAVTAEIKSLDSIFYNPAGLTEIDNYSIMVSAQTLDTILPINFLGFSKTFHFHQQNLKLALAFGLYSRLVFYSEGKIKKDDFESIFLQFALPGRKSELDGTIDSKTIDYRFAIAAAPLNNRWSVGFSTTYVNCATTFGGIYLEDPTNYIVRDTWARTFSYSFGAKYFITKNIIWGTHIKNLFGTLVSDNDIKDKNGNYSYHTEGGPIPIDFATGISWNFSDKFILGTDIQRIFGEYGTYSVDFKLARVSGSIVNKNKRYNFGLMVPLSLKSEGINVPSLPIPIVPTTGLGWDFKDFTFAIALYVHPIETFQIDKPAFNADISLEYQF
jgi:hypothetical protein